MPDVPSSALALLASADTPVCDAEPCMHGQVEIKTTKETPDAGNLQKAADFVQAFILGEL